MTSAESRRIANMLRAAVEVHALMKEEKARAYWLGFIEALQGVIDENEDRTYAD